MRSACCGRNQGVAAQDRGGGAGSFSPAFTIGAGGFVAGPIAESSWSPSRIVKSAPEAVGCSGRRRRDEQTEALAPVVELLGVGPARDQQLDQVVLGAVVSWYLPSTSNVAKAALQLSDALFVACKQFGRAQQQQSSKSRALLAARARR